MTYNFVTDPKMKRGHNFGLVYVTNSIVEDDPESPFNEQFAPEFDNKFLDRIISMAASLFEGNSGDAKYQIDIFQY